MKKKYVIPEESIKDQLARLDYILKGLPTLLSESRIQHWKDICHGTKVNNDQHFFILDEILLARTVLKEINEKIN